MAARRYPLGLMTIAPVVIGVGVYAFTGQEQMTPIPGDETPTATATMAATATTDAETAAVATGAAIEATAAANRIAYPTATPEMPKRGDLHDGAWVGVNAGAGDCLNARWTPGTTAEYGGVNVCLPDGYEGLLTGTAQPGEGRWWWNMAGAGWVAEEFLVYLHDADIRAPMAPQYASQPGTIAFLREAGAIWAMRPDGSGQREIVPAHHLDGYNVWPSDLSWSPDGTLLSYVTTRWTSDGTPPSADLHVVDIDGNEVATFTDTAGRSWAPDGTRIAVVASAVPGDMGGGWKGTPGYVDLATGALTMLPPPSANEDLWLQDLPSFNHDGALMLMPYSWYQDETHWERGVLITDLTGIEVDRIIASEADYFATPVWSPAADQIAMERSDSDGTSTYAVYDLGTRSFVASAPVPARSQNRGGGCGGGADMARSAWSRDGSKVMFGYMFGEAGTNGIWTLDVASGATALLPVANTYNAVAGPGFLASFSDGGHIFIGDTAGGYPTLITDGHSPVWSSGQ